MNEANVKIMSNRFHSKYHRNNHHTNPSVGDRDSSHDPIASPEHPFQGEFVLNGRLSAHNPSGEAAIFDDDILIRGTLSSDHIESDSVFANVAYFTELHTISSFTHYQDILISELSGFNVTGDVTIEGNVSIDDTIYVDKIKPYLQTSTPLSVYATIEALNNIKTNVITPLSTQYFEIKNIDGLSLLRVGTGTAKNGVEEGVNTVATGASSHAEGFGTLASGSSSHAEGFSTRAIGNSSHAGGAASSAGGIVSRATGRRAIVRALNQFGTHPADDGSVVEADNQNSDLISSAQNKRTARFANGYRWFGGAHEVYNDVEITNPTKGIILRSPDNTRWRITIDNSGNLSSNPV